MSEGSPRHLDGPMSLIPICIGSYHAYFVSDPTHDPYSYKLEQLASSDDMESDSYMYWVSLQRTCALASRIKTWHTYPTVKES